jgi:UDP-3-O-[3-hydroxymyristoyl] glucosamine N-acyltransferase
MKTSQQKTQYSLAELTNELEVTIVGDPNCLINSVATLEQAKAGQIAFLMSSSHKKHLITTQASAVILIQSDLEACPVNAIVSRDPYYTYAKIAAYFDNKKAPASGIHASAVIGRDCAIDSSVSIGPNSVIGDGVKLASRVIIGPGCSIGDFVELGDDTHLDANVTLYHRVKLGRRVQIASGVVIGSDGFGNAKHKGVWHKVPQLGSVMIEDDVEIGANCSIDRGTIEDTVIERGAKLDNLIQVAHNVRIGANTAIAGCVGIAGSAVIGKNCLIGGGVGITGHIAIADGVMITGMTAVTKSIREPGIYSSGVGGLVTNLEWRKNSARLHRLDQMAQRIKALETALEAVTERKET